MQRCDGYLNVDEETGHSSLFYTWEAFFQILLIAFSKVSAANFQPDTVVGILRGGFYLSDIITRTSWGKHALIAYIVSRRYDQGIQGQEEYQAQSLLFLPSENGDTERAKKENIGTNILVVDELTDSGKSLQKTCEMVRGYVFAHGGEEPNIKTLTAWHKQTSLFKPDFFGEEIIREPMSRQCPWIITPWEQTAKLFDAALTPETNGARGIFDPMKGSLFWR